MLGIDTNDGPTLNHNRPSIPCYRHLEGGLWVRGSENRTRAWELHASRKCVPKKRQAQRVKQITLTQCSLIIVFDTGPTLSQLRTNAKIMAVDLDINNYTWRSYLVCFYNHDRHRPTSFQQPSMLCRLILSSHYYSMGL